MKKKVEPIVFTLIDTLHNDYGYDSYKEMCEANDWEIHEIYSDDYYDVINMLLQNDVDNFMSNMKYSEVEDVVITGSCGTWRGRRDIVPVYCKDLISAVNKVLNDIEYFKCEFNDGVLNFECYHHDGTNCFSIRPLNHIGLKEYYADRIEQNGDKDWLYKKFKIDQIC